MSGIAGLQTLTGAAPAQSILTGLGRALAHRGPDGEGRHTSGGTALLHTALARDPSAAEQPFVEPEGWVAAADGLAQSTLPGLRQLSQSLLAEGDRPADDLLPFQRDVSGYALAIHDPVEDRLLLTRDRFGRHPLYYAETAQGLVFASEPRAIAASGVLKPTLRKEAARELLQLQFNTGAATLFSGIARVLPGETLVVEGGRVVARRRANLPPATVETPRDDAEPLVALEAGLRDALQLSLADRARTGLYATAGLESLALLATLRKLGQRDVPVVSALYGERDDLTQMLTKASGVEPDWVRVTAQDFWALLPKVALALDDPGADYGAVALYAVAQQAGRTLDTLVVPEGGAELFGLYGRYRSLLRPVWLGGRSMRARGFLEGLSVLRDDASTWRDGLRAAESRLAQSGYTRLQAAQGLDCAFWLANDRLSVLDRCFAPHGLAARTPFLMASLARFAFTLPDRLKVSGSQGGVLLRRWLAKAAPDLEIHRQMKPATFPALQWVAEDAARLGPLVADNAGIAELCRPGAVTKLFSRVGTSHSKRLGHAAWQLLFFALWHAVHIEGKSAQGDTVAVLSAK